MSWGTVSSTKLSLDAVASKTFSKIETKKGNDDSVDVTERNSNFKMPARIQRKISNHLSCDGSQDDLEIRPNNLVVVSGHGLLNRVDLCCFLDEVGRAKVISNSHVHSISHNSTHLNIKGNIEAKGFAIICRKKLGKKRISEKDSPRASTGSRRRSLAAYALATFVPMRSPVLLEKETSSASFIPATSPSPN